MKNKIICLVLSLVLIGSLIGANGAYAWFVSSTGGTSGVGNAKHYFTTGNIGYTLIGDLDYQEGADTIIPEEELLIPLDEEDKLTFSEECKMYLKNTSPIASQLRIKIVYSYDNVNENVYDGGESSPLTVDFINAEGWTYDSGYFYYGSYDSESQNSDVIQAFDATQEGATPEIIPLFSSIRYSGENTESDKISGKEHTVKVIFEARQSEHVNWTDVGTIYTSETE